MSKKYIDVYKNCIGCPVHKYCGTMIGNIRLCNSYKEEQESNVEEPEEEEYPDWLVNDLQGDYEDTMG